MTRPRRPLPGPKDAETDPRFPSGKWVGFWLQRHYVTRQYMSLNLSFADGVVRGFGSDRVGDFAMNGTYDLKSGNCSILKAYDGAHSVQYDGRNEGDGLWLWGLWQIRAFDRGGFHMWPAGVDDPTGRKLKTGKELEIDRPRIRLAPDAEPVAAPSSSDYQSGPRLEAASRPRGTGL